jgi:hypothetical protein
MRSEGFTLLQKGEVETDLGHGHFLGGLAQSERSGNHMSAGEDAPPGDQKSRSDDGTVLSKNPNDGRF